MSNFDDFLLLLGEKLVHRITIFVVVNTSSFSENATDLGVVFAIILICYIIFAINDSFVPAVMIFYNEINEERKFCKTTRVCFIVRSGGASGRFTNTMT